MPTQTEQHLQAIVDKIENVRKIQNSAQGPNLSLTSQTIISDDIKTIGEHVSLLPKEFKDTHNNIPWAVMENWAASSLFPSSNFNFSSIVIALHNINVAEPRISMHLPSNRNIQNGIIASLDSYYGHLCADWHEDRKRHYIFISLTGILVIIRAAIRDTVALTSQQIIIYALLAIVVVWITIDIHAEREIYRIYDSPYRHYFTYTEFFVRARFFRQTNINQLNKLRKKHSNTRDRQGKLWWMLSIASTSITFTDYIFR